VNCARSWNDCRRAACGAGIQDIVGGVQHVVRVATLYFGKVFSCRTCYGLVYDSKNGTRRNRGVWRAQSIRLKLGGSANLSEPFPEKPKGMHWRTYMQLREEARFLSDKSYVVTLPSLLPN